MKQRERTFTVIATVAQILLMLFFSFGVIEAIDKQRWSALTVAALAAIAYFLRRIAVALESKPGGGAS